MAAAHLSRIQLVCFDLGGVVVRTCGSSREGCERAGVPYHPAVDEPSVRARFRELEMLYELGLCTSPQYFARAETVLGGLQSAADIARVHDAWIMGEYEGMERLVLSLKNLGVATGCLSNTNDRHWELMTTQPRAYPAFRAFTHRDASHLLGMAKPDPAIYRTVAERCGVPAESIVFFDDRADNVRGARAAGWRAELVDPRGDTAAQMAAVLRDLGFLGSLPSV